MSACSSAAPGSALWSAIPTAGVTLTRKGSLSEDVNGSNIVVSGTKIKPIARPLQMLGRMIDDIPISIERRKIS